jgi:hypothetical protein
MKAVTRHKAQMIHVWVVLGKGTTGVNVGSIE